MTVDQADPEQIGHPNRMEQLSREECLEGLGRSYLGRIGFLREGKFSMLPANYMFADGAIYIATVMGGSMSHLDAQDVAFEVDSVRPLTHSGWSVVVQGVATLLSDPREIEDLTRGPLQSWAWRQPDQWLRISADNVTGRRVLES